MKLGDKNNYLIMTGDGENFIDNGGRYLSVDIEWLFQNRKPILSYRDKNGTMRVIEINIDVADFLGDLLSEINSDNNLINN